MTKLTIQVHEKKSYELTIQDILDAMPEDGKWDSFTDADVGEMMWQAIRYHIGVGAKLLDQHVGEEDQYRYDVDFDFDDCTVTLRAMNDPDYTPYMDVYVAFNNDTSRRRRRRHPRTSNAGYAYGPENGLKSLDDLYDVVIDLCNKAKEDAFSSNESRKLRESGEDFVGNQKFTYKELENAWNELNDKIKNDPFDSKNPPSGGYDIRNGYHCEDLDWHDWEMDFTLEDISKELESIPKTITRGDLEVYYNDREYNQADPDDHGILIEDGKILAVY